MSNPARPCMMPLAPIDATNDERLNMTVLWRIAQGITRERAQARSLWTAKGGTGLAVGDGLPRPSTDLGIDVNRPIDAKMAVHINGEEYDRFDTQAHAIAHLRRLGFNRGREKAPLESPPPAPWRSRFP